MLNKVASRTRLPIEYLESKSDLRKLNGTLQKELLKATLMKRLWVSDGK